MSLSGAHMESIPCWQVLQHLREDRTSASVHGDLMQVEKRLKKYLETNVRLAGMNEFHMQDLMHNIAPDVTREEFVAIVDLLPVEPKKLVNLMPSLVGRYNETTTKLHLPRHIAFVVVQALKDVEVSRSQEIAQQPGASGSEEEGDDSNGGDPRPMDEEDAARSVPLDQTIVTVADDDGDDDDGDDDDEDDDDD